MATRRRVLLSLINNGEESVGSLITFTIAGTEYQAEAGMTWEEWCNDINYNSTGKWIVFNGGVYSKNLEVQIVITLSDTAHTVLSNDVINEIDYQLIIRGSSGGS